MKTAQKTPFIDGFVTMPPCVRTIAKTCATTAGPPAKHSNGLEAIFALFSPASIERSFDLLRPRNLFDTRTTNVPTHPCLVSLAHGQESWALQTNNSRIQCLDTNGTPSNKLANDDRSEHQLRRIGVRATLPSPWHNHRNLT